MLKCLLNLTLVIILFDFSIGYAETNLNRIDIEHHKVITLNFYQAETSAVLQALADYQQLNLLMTEDITKTVTIKLVNVTWQKALERVLDLADLNAEIDENILIISKTITPAMEHQQRQQKQQEYELNLPLEYLSLKVNHIDIQQLVNLIQQQGLLSIRGKTFADSRTQTLVVYDISQQFSAIERLTQEFDRELPQIHILAHIININNESFSQLGIKWGYSGHASQTINDISLGTSVNHASQQVGFSVAKIAGNLLNLELSALEAENQLAIVASPNLLTSNQHTASIKQGTEIPYEVSSGGNGATSIEFKQAVLGLEVTPRILNNGRLELNLYISQNTEGRMIQRSDGGEALAIDTQEIRTQVVVNSGETLVLGGIFQQLNTQDSDSVPGLSKLPILGSLFEYRSEKQQQRELVIFITPQIVN